MDVFGRSFLDLKVRRFVAGHLEFGPAVFLKFDLNIFRDGFSNRHLPLAKIRVEVLIHVPLLPDFRQILTLSLILKTRTLILLVKLIVERVLMHVAELLGHRSSLTGHLLLELLHIQT